MFEEPQKAQVVRIKIEAFSLDSTSMAPSLDGPLLGRKRPANSTLAGLGEPEFAGAAADRDGSGSGRQRSGRITCETLCPDFGIVASPGGLVAIPTIVARTLVRVA